MSSVDASQPSTSSIPSEKKPQTRKGKMGSNDTAELVKNRLSQLEQDVAGEKDQEIEIEKEVKRAIRGLTETLNKIEDPMARLDTTKTKYAKLYGDMKRLEREHIKSKKKADTLQKEQDKLKNEASKATSMREKLEKLCRELSKNNKDLKDDNKRLEESEKRAKEMVNGQLGDLLSNAQDIMNSKGSPQSGTLVKDLDEIFKIRLKAVVEQNDLRELHFKSILRQKDAELQWTAAKYEEQRRKAEEQAGKCRQLSNQVSTFSFTESELRHQLNIYVDKFKAVEDTLNNSNELFMTFRREMDGMGKKTKRLEKENLTLTRKHDQTKSNIIQMAEERTRDKQELGKLRKKETQMRSIIQTMREQGRGSSQALEAEIDDEGTESDYDEEYDEEEGDDESYDGEEELPDEVPKPFIGPAPPPSLVEAPPNRGPPLTNGTAH
ncbi:MAG: hypothetical protein Q9227_003240 [Pyrenula ochraceoflavens]